MSHNYPGFLGISGHELLVRLREQALKYGALVQTGEVELVGPKPDGFVVECRTGIQHARFVVLATGLVDESPAVEGLEDLSSLGLIRYCPICDGYEATDKRIAVLGPIEAAANKALFLRTYSSNVRLYALDNPSDQLILSQKLLAAGVQLAGPPVRVVQHRGAMRVFVEDHDSYEADIIYPALGCRVRSQLATTIGARCAELGNLSVDEHQQTTVERLYAVGDVVTDLHQLAVGVGHAAIAATHIHNRLPSHYR